MNQQLHHRLLYYALIAVAISSIFYLLSAFGLLKIYAHFLGDTHIHKWHTLSRMCFVAVFAIVNHLFLVPQFYIQRRYLSFFVLILVCLVSVWILPDIMLPQPQFDPQNFVSKDSPPLGLQVLLIELAHIYLLFFISIFTSIAIKTHSYIKQIEEQQASTVALIEQQQQAISTIEQEDIVEKQIETALTVNVNYSLIRIEFSDILFIKSMDNYLHFHLKDKKPILVRKTLKEALEKLPTAEFLRVH